MDSDMILDKGLTDESALSEKEKLVFSVAYLESIADMEGWDHFFTYSMRLYPNVIKLLKLTNDQASLNILYDYEEHFKKLGVNFAPKEIDIFLTKAPESYFNSCPDWRELFDQASKDRWAKIEHKKIA